MPGQFAANLQADPVQEQKQHSQYKKEKIITFKNYRSKGVLFFGTINLLMALLLSRFMIPGSILPAGVAFGLATIDRQLKLWEKFLILIAIVLGTWSVKGLIFAGGIGGALLILHFWIQFWYHRKGTSLKKLRLFISWALLRLALVGLFQVTPALLFSTGCELGLSFVLATFFQISFSFWDNPLKTFSKLTLPALAIMIILALGGIRGLTFYSISLAEIFAVLLLVIVAYLGGGGVGAAMGISIAVVLGIGNGDLIKLITIFSVVGLLAGLLKDLRKWGTLVGTCLGLFLVWLQLHLNIFTINTLPWGIGLVCFILIPHRYLSQFSNYFPNQSLPEGSPEDQKQLREILNNRLTDLAKIFEELAKSFNEVDLQPKDTPKMDLYTLLDQVCTKNCQHCNGYEVCWGENFYSTYREIFDLIAFAELYGEVGTKHLKGRLAKNCFQQFKLLATINQLFEKCQVDYVWQRKLEESKVFLANQLKGVSGLISNLAVEITTDTCFKTEVEEKIRHGFNRIGMSVREVSVLSVPGQGLEIKIKQGNCNQKRECQYLAGAMISRLLDREYSVWERSCHIQDGTCSYCLTPTRNYEVKTTVCKLPKSGNEFSGDNHGLQELKEGYFIAILSDGMGHGSKACAESNTTVSLLEKLLKLGIDRDFALKMVNSVLLLHSQEESFATVDMVMINLYSAQAEFIKIGAAVTYIKRGREVWSIKSTSLPAGILNTVDLERTNMDLQPGDLIIMVTDGIVDSKVNQPGKEEWMIRALKQVEVVGPEALGEYLLNLARINQDGVLRDDMTVIVLLLLEKNLQI